MRNFTLVDETFDINITESYHLSVLIAESGLSFAIMDTIRKKYIALKNIVFEDPGSSSTYNQIVRLFRTDNYLNKPYKSTGLVYTTSKVALVPNPIFDPNELEKLFGFTNTLPENQELLHKNINSIDARVIYSVPVALQNTINDNSPNQFEILHQSCPLIENAVRKAKTRVDEEFVFLQVHHGFFELAIIKNGNLELYNTFSYKTTEDLIFYTLYVYEQFDLNPGRVSLNLSGQIENNSELTEKLVQFIPNIKFDKFSRNFTYSYTFGQLIQHQFTNLINIYPCV